jgi:hypothetical protein
MDPKKNDVVEAVASGPSPKVVIYDDELKEPTSPQAKRELEARLERMFQESGGQPVIVKGRARGLKHIPGNVLARAFENAKDAPEADPVAVNFAAKEIYRQLPGKVLAQLQWIAKTHGNNRHARRATKAILDRHFKGVAANARKYAAKKANRDEQRKTPVMRTNVRKTERVTE